MWQAPAIPHGPSLWPLVRILPVCTSVLHPLGGVPSPPACWGLLLQEAREENGADVEGGGEDPDLVLSEPLFFPIHGYFVVDNPNNGEWHEERIIEEARQATN